MAKLDYTPAVKETKVVEVSPATYNVTLNEKEFVALMVLVGLVGGEPKGIRDDVLTPLWDDIFSKKFMSEFAFKTDSLYDNYRNQIKGHIYT